MSDRSISSATRSRRGRGSRQTRRILSVLAGLVLAPAGSVSAQRLGRIEGAVLSRDAEPIAGAEVRLVDLSRRVSTDARGRYVFVEVPPGSYVLEALSLTAGRAVSRVVVAAGQAVSLDLTLAAVYEGDEILVTAGGVVLESEIYQPASALSGTELLTLSEASLGETLSGQPGVNSTSFGPGASRPIIRGLERDRVSVLDRGISTADASTNSPDHAVTVDPLAAHQVEIIRGPATLLYGSQAIGGVVNTVDGRIPAQLPIRPVEGRVTLRGGTVANEFAGAAEITGRAGSVAWHVAGLRRETDDYEIPGFAERDLPAEHEEGELPPDGEHTGEEPSGVLANSALETTRAAVGLSFVGRNGYAGVAWSGFDSEYGVPGHHAEEEGEPDPGAEPEAEEGEVVDARQRRVDLEGAWRFASGVFRGLRARFGVANYDDRALAGSVVETTKQNDEWEGRLELEHGDLGPLSGIVGVQVGSREFAAAGEEAFVPPSETDRWGVFLFEEVATGAVRWQLGARYERQDVTDISGANSLDHDGFSTSVGALWTASEHVGLALSGARSVKLPRAEELFSNGPHLPTFQFEIGDESLTEEVGYSVDASLRLARGPVSGSVTVFSNWFSDFVFLSPTGEEEAGLGVFQYVQGDAVFSGVEVEAGVALLGSRDRNVTLVGFTDYVRAELTATDEPLPRIPPLRYGVGVDYDGGGVFGHAGIKHVNEQERVAGFETTTPGHTLLDGTIGYNLPRAGVVHQFSLRGTNLSDEEARNHVSFLKDQAPLPGREVRFTYRLIF